MFAYEAQLAEERDVGEPSSLNALMRLFVNPAQWCDILVIVSVVCAWVAKRSYWRGIDTARELHTVESATGLGHLGKVKLLDPPHSSENYLMREMGFKVARKHARRLRAIAQTLGPSIENVILALSITYWPFWARLVFAETRSLKNEVFIESAIALGASPLRVMTLHVLPNIASAIIVRTSIGMGATILTAAALGFLGLGAPPPTPEWGRMIAESREFLPEAWWYAAVPGVAIFMVVMGFNLLGDGLRDFLDPRIRRGAGAK